MRAILRASANVKSLSKYNYENPEEGVKDFELETKG
jgi:hypothetical protein